MPPKMITREFRTEPEAYEFSRPYLNERGLARKGVKRVRTTYPDRADRKYVVTVEFSRVR